MNALTGADGSFDSGVSAGPYNVGISDRDLRQRGLAASRSGFAPFYNANATAVAAWHFDFVVFDDSWNVQVSGSDLAHRGLPGAGNRTALVSGRNATVNFILSRLTAPRLQGLPGVDAKFQVQILGEIGPRYIRESSLTFPPLWNTVLDTNSPSGSYDVIDPSSGAGTPRRFYRVNVTQSRRGASTPSPSVQSARFARSYRSTKSVSAGSLCAR